MITIITVRIVHDNPNRIGLLIERIKREVKVTLNIPDSSTLVRFENE